MKKIDDRDRTLCPDCDAQYIQNVAQDTSDRIENTIEPTILKVREGLRDLSLLLLDIYKANPYDKHAMSLIHEFGMLVNDSLAKIEMKEESLFYVDGKLADAFITDIESREDVYLCQSCYNQSCDHNEE